MNEKNSRRVVIIEDIDSDSIEQAIFILRNSGSGERPERGTIVREAERVINAYARTLKMAQNGVGGQGEKDRQKPGKNRAGVMIGLACLLMAGILSFCLKKMGAGI